MDSDVTVASVYTQREPTDYRVEWFSGSGAGGQHRNKHQNSCRVHHIPSGLVEARQGRKREANYRDAFDALNRTLDAAQTGAVGSVVSAERKGQVGTGMRGDKTVTIRFQDDRVTHHETGKSMSATRYMKGFMDEVWR